jgi:hypothetical protein
LSKHEIAALTFIRESLAALAARGWSARKIARELDIHRETVGRYLCPEPISKPAILPARSKAGNRRALTTQCPNGQVLKLL